MKTFHPLQRVDEDVLSQVKKDNLALPGSANRRLTRAERIGTEIFGMTSNVAGFILSISMR